MSSKCFFPVPLKYQLGEFRLQKYLAIEDETRYWHYVHASAYLV